MRASSAALGLAVLLWNTVMWVPNTYPGSAVEHWAWQASFPPLRNDYQGKKRRLSCALLPPYKLIISPSICFFSLRSHNGVTFSIFSRALLARSRLCRATFSASTQAPASNFGRGSVLQEVSIMFLKKWQKMLHAGGGHFCRGIFPASPLSLGVLHCRQGGSNQLGHLLTAQLGPMSTVRF